MSSFRHETICVLEFQFENNNRLARFEGANFFRFSSNLAAALNRAGEEVVLEAEGDGHEDEVEDEHAQAHPLCHLPAEDQDGEENLENN